ncbi:hypothetical protein B0H34DRAFT_681214 [Crassisporium funariophilum]|nr:hypothetical protein B0H34DRAFT_681214 [Crassisporium funariophilum]
MPPMAAKFNPREWRITAQLFGTRQRRWLVGGLTFTLIFFLLVSHPSSRNTLKHKYSDLFPDFSSPPVYDADQPPTWERLWQWERDLPQHNLDLPFPEGRTGRYVLFKNQIQGLGWNNQLNEVLMNTWLAYKSKRAYVFQEYMWNHGHYPWPKEKFRQQNPTTPLNALLSGPSAGGPWDPEDDAPRSISEAWFDVVCPKAERRIIFTGDVKPAVYWEMGNIIFDHWQKVLTDAPERCVEVTVGPNDTDAVPQTFDLWLWGSTRVLSLWDAFRDSPVTRLLAPSPVVRAAVDRNEYLFLPRGPRPAHPASRNPYDRMLAVHLRRGDYEGHCTNLANWNTTFYSWNLLPFLPDQFEHPSPIGYEPGKNTPEGYAHYLKHCYPNHDQILEKIEKSREEYIRAAKPGEYRTLDVIFLLTNDRTSWVDDLKATLQKSKWHTVVTTRDLEMDQEQKDAGMTVDMEFARMAAVFIGNGWSSFTSNIVHRRLADKKEPISTRFF